MKIKKKLRDLTEEEYKEWLIKKCNGLCKNCIFKCVMCYYNRKICWVNNKEVFSDKFLDQELEIEVNEK